MKFRVRKARRRFGRRQQWIWTLIGANNKVVCSSELLNNLEDALTTIEAVKAAASRAPVEVQRD
jgi:uncharacterized protein YegP (UPF0339 family)